MPQPRKYATNAERQRAYRARKRAELIAAVRKQSQLKRLAPALERGDARAWGMLGNIVKQSYAEKRRREREQWEREVYEWFRNAPTEPPRWASMLRPTNSPPV